MNYFYIVDVFLMNIDVWAQVAVFTHVHVSRYETQIFRRLMGGQRDTLGFGTSQLGIRAKVNDYLGSSVGVELGI